MLRENNCSKRLNNKRYIFQTSKGCLCIISNKTETNIIILKFSKGPKTTKQQQKTNFAATKQSYVKICAPHFV